jgi:hypothetical protein
LAPGAGTICATTGLSKNIAAKKKKRKTLAGVNGIIIGANSLAFKKLNYSKQGLY